MSGIELAKQNYSRGFAAGVRSQSERERRLEEALKEAFRGHDKMDREGLDRWRSIAGKGGHDLATINLTSLSRLITTIDTLEAGARAALNPTLKAEGPMDKLEERLRAYRGGTTEWRDLMDKAADEITRLKGEVERLTAERDAYRTQAVNRGWDWRLCDAYGREEYQRHLESEVDQTLVNMLARSSGKAGSDA